MRPLPDEAVDLVRKTSADPAFPPTPRAHVFGLVQHGKVVVSGVVHGGWGDVLPGCLGGPLWSRLRIIN